MIEFDRTTRTYGSKVAVSELSLTIPRGELFALLGPNGAGKTTTIKMLVGLLRPSSGVVRVCGHDLVKETRSAHRHVGYYQMSRTFTTVYRAEPYDSLPTCGDTDLSDEYIVRD